MRALRARGDLVPSRTRISDPFKKLGEPPPLAGGNVHVYKTAVGKSARDAKPRLMLEERARRILRHRVHGRRRFYRKPAALELLRQIGCAHQSERRRISERRARHAVELRRERGKIAAGARRYLFAVGQLRKIERGNYVVHAVVMVLVLGERSARKLTRRRFPVAADQSSAAAVYAFGERDDAVIAVRAARSALVIAAERVARKLYHGHAVALAKRREHVEVRDRAERVIDNDRRRQFVLQARPNERRFERGGGHAPRRRVAVDKYRRRVHARHRRHVRIERKRRHENIVAFSRAAQVQRSMERRVRRTHNDASPAVQRAERGFQLSHVIGAAQRVAHSARRAACPVEKHHTRSMRRIHSKISLYIVSIFLIGKDSIHPFIRYMSCRTVKLYIILYSDKIIYFCTVLMYNNLMTISISRLYLRISYVADHSRKSSHTIEIYDNEAYSIYL